MTPSIVYLLLKLNELVSKFLDAPFYNSVECCILLLWNPLAPHLFSMNFQKSLLKVLHLLLLALLAISDAVIQSCGFINTSPGILFIFPLICLWLSQIIGRIQALQFFFFYYFFPFDYKKAALLAKRPQFPNAGVVVLVQAISWAQEDCFLLDSFSVCDCNQHIGQRAWGLSFCKGKLVKYEHIPDLEIKTSIAWIADHTSLNPFYFKFQFWQLSKRSEGI